MTYYENVAVSEVLPTVLLGISVVLCLLSVGAAVALMIVNRSLRNPKEEARLHKLRQQAALDENARRELERKERKQERKKQKNQSNRIYKGALLLLCFALALLNLFMNVLPLAEDLICKDYQVYEGTVEIIGGRHGGVLLEDGTRLTGTKGLDYDTKEAKIVYTRRSHVTVGAEKIA